MNDKKEIGTMMGGAECPSGGNLMSNDEKSMRQICEDWDYNRDIGKL